MISSSNCAYQIQALKHQINVTLKEIRKTVDVGREKEIDDLVKGMKMLQEESRMLKAAKMLNRKRFENPFVHNKDGKYISNPEEVYKIKKYPSNVISMRKVLNYYPRSLARRKTSINQLQQKK